MSNAKGQSGPHIPPAHSTTAKRSHQWVAVLLASILGVGLFAGTSFAILYHDLTSRLNASVLDTGHLKPPPQSAPKEELPPDSFAGRPVNILLMGIDARADQDTALVGDDFDETMRSDTTLVMHISEDRENITLVSIPRDQWVLLPECQRTDGSISYEQWGQFNWAFSYGALTDDLAGGVNCTEKMVESLTGLQMDGFAIIDFTGFSKMVEALGGVEMCLEETLRDSKYIQMEFPAGCYKMDPKMATQYARVRYVGDGSDMGRIQRQQQLIGAMVKQALASNLLTEVDKLYAFVTSTLQATTVSPSLGNVGNVMGLVLSVRNIDPENIRFTTMPVVTADFDPNRLLPKEPNNTQFWEAIRTGQQLIPGTVYQDMNGDYFTIGEDGISFPGGDPRTDNEIGSLNDWSPEG